MSEVKITRKQLEDTRKKAGLKSQVEAAKFLGVSDTTYRRWLRGASQVPYMAWLCLTLKKQNIKLQNPSKTC